MIIHTAVQGDLKLLYVTAFGAMTSPDSDMSTTVTSTSAFVTDLRRIAIFEF
jgi:hypothetical protein